MRPVTGWSARGVAASAGALVVAAAGCASTQQIPLDCVPEPITLYVDGEALEEIPESLELRRDQPHTLFFKGPGYQSELVVLRSEEKEGEPWLTPSELCVRPVLIGVERRIEVEVEAEEPAPGAEDAGPGSR